MTLLMHLCSSLLETTAVGKHKRYNLPFLAEHHAICIQISSILHMAVELLQIYLCELLLLFRDLRGTERIPNSVSRYSACLKLH